MKLITIIIIIFFVSNLKASNIGSETGFKIPRFASIKSNEVNVRIGPSTNYPIKITYITKNYPIKIIDEYKDWRKVSDYFDNVGWIKKNLLSGQRFGIIKSNNQRKTFVYFSPIDSPIGEIKRFNIVEINRCFVNWCHINYDRYKGWVEKNNIWGVSKEEIYNISFLNNFEEIIWYLNIYIRRAYQALITIKN